MLPSGSGKVDVNKHETKVRITTLFARNTTGNWRTVDNVRLLHPIPIQYLSPILSKEFGLKENAGAIRPGIQSHLAAKLSTLWAKDVAEQDQKEVKAWLRGKLKEQNLDGPLLKVVQTEEIISIPDGLKLNETVIYANTLRLDQ
ncbi:hypothetical protein [Rufibacter latericius]|nr:hypothetical protein [Rufibacter latericius]